MMWITKLKVNREKYLIWHVAFGCLAYGVPLGFGSWGIGAIAQPITPAQDGTGTVVTPQDNRYDITGGQLSGDGANLFHSFSQFNLDAGQIANFRSNPAIQNILGRVTGGNASIINGLIQVTGGNSNLFLMNATGIVFGPSASLNVPGSFLATTANGIGFDSGWFNSTGPINYAQLVGTPSTLYFGGGAQGAIANFGNLSVADNNQLNLIGGTVISTGTLAAPSGQITVAAVPGENLVRLSQPGHLLSLEVQPIAGAVGTVRLPELLTGGGASGATDVTVNSDGQIVLTGSGVRVDAGDVVVKNISAQTATVAAGNNLTLVDSQLTTTGNLDLKAGDTVRVRDRLTNPFVAKAGGNLTIQGNQQIDIFALNNPSSGIFAGGDLVVRSPIVLGDARYSSGGDFRIEQPDGSLGDLFSPNDPFIFATGDVSLGNYTGASLGIVAGGSVTLGDVTITGADPNAIAPELSISLPDGSSIAPDLRNSPQLLVLSGVDPSAPELGGIPLKDAVQPPESVSPNFSAFSTGANIKVGNIFIQPPNGAVILTNTQFPNLALTGGTIQTGQIFTRSNTAKGGNVVLSARSGISSGEINAGSLDGNSGNVSLATNDGNIRLSGTLNASSELGAGGNVTIVAGGDIVTGFSNSVLVGNPTITSTGVLRGGNISLTSRNGAIDLSAGNLVSGYSIERFRDDGTIIFAYASDRGGAIALNAAGNITTQDVTSFGLSNGGNISIRSGGAIKMEGVSSGGLIITPRGNSFSTNTSGDIAIAAEGDISTNDIRALSFGGAGGNITLSSNRGSVSTVNVDAGGSSQGGAIAIGALDGIETGDLNVAAPFVGSAIANGGSVNLISPNNIVVSSINAEGSSSGGNVNVTTSQFFRAIESFESTVGGAIASISTVGGTTGGAIAIEHGGGSNMTPFVVGDPFSPNGTAAAIISGRDNAIATAQSFPESYTQGNIQIITSKPGTIQPGTNQVAPITAETTESGTTESGTTESGTTESGTTESGTTESGTTESGTTESGITESGITESGITESGITESGITESGITESGITESGTTSGGTILPGTTKPGTILSRITERVNILQGTILPGTTEPRTIPLRTTPGYIFPRSPVPPMLQRTPFRRGERSPQGDRLVQPIPRINSPEFARASIESVMAAIEEPVTQQFEEYLGVNNTNPIKTLSDGQDITQEIEKATGVKPAFIYVNFVPDVLGQQLDKDQLELLLVSSNDSPIRRRVPEAQRSQVLEVAKKLRNQITDAKRRQSKSYLAAAEQLYNWIIAPLETDLKAQGINNLVFIMDAGLRSLPIAALYNGQEFLIERYSVGLIPSLSLTDLRYSNLKNTQILAMGASTFQQLSPLPAVPLELSTIAGKIWQGEYFLNEGFTLDNFKSQHAQRRFGIIHLATHAEFNAGDISNSYIQLWDSKLRLDQIGQLSLNNPPVELLVLSACRTAVGNEQAELGFAGLAYKAGVKTALASLWYVSDEGTLGLMTEFYRQLAIAPVKAEALRRAQVAMLKGEVRLQDGQLVGTTGSVPLPSSLVNLGNIELSHPYYWAAFTMIGNPW